MMTDKELLVIARQDIHDLKAQLAAYRAVFIRYVHEHEPAPWDLAEEIADRLLGIDDDPDNPRTNPA